jgi:hypothetical protein
MYTPTETGTRLILVEMLGRCVSFPPCPYLHLRTSSLRLPYRWAWCWHQPLPRPVFRRSSPLGALQLESANNNNNEFNQRWFRGSRARRRQQHGVDQVHHAIARVQGTNHVRRALARGDHPARPRQALPVQGRGNAPAQVAAARDPVRCTAPRGAGARASPAPPRRAAPRP